MNHWNPPEKANFFTTMATVPFLKTFLYGGGALIFVQVVIF
jgi:hypothetical protein